MSLQEKIMAAIEYSDKEFSDVADVFMGDSVEKFRSEYLKKRINTGKFSQDELKELADIIGCEYLSEIRLPNGMTLYDGNGKFTERTSYNIMDTKTRIIVARNSVGMSQKELCNIIGMTSSAFTQRLNTGKFKYEELQKIAAALGGTYDCYFNFCDGDEIIESI